MWLLTIFLVAKVLILFPENNDIVEVLHGERGGKRVREGEKERGRERG